eukprot:TRINITY_DN27682_c0_g1_i1.p1 TRINITY_DN27682_c0_g1~~TRINITY_DN27682_c0_g1_i1.p1  ORF type:complete len:370 (-),score=62.71 TRINITY_DN27682_c0_g1_i1:72-1079(-)
MARGHPSSPSSPASPEAPQTSRSIADIATDYLKAARRFSDVRRNFPERIDALVAKEIMLQLKHDMWRRIGVAAAKMKGGIAARLAAMTAMREVCLAAADAMELLGARAEARQAMPHELMGKVRDMAAEAVREVLPVAASLADRSATTEIARKAEAEAVLFRNKFEALLEYKTLLTERLEDSDLAAVQKKKSLLEEAVILLETPNGSGKRGLPADMIIAVSEFLTAAILLKTSDVNGLKPLQRRALSCLSQCLLPGDDCGSSSWQQLAYRVLEEVGSQCMERLPMDTAAVLAPHGQVRAPRFSDAYMHRRPQRCLNESVPLELAVAEAGFLLVVST